MTTYDPQLLEKYAELAIRVGLNLEPGQRLLISGAPVQLAPLVRLLTKQAYLAGARFVDVLWYDEELDRLRLQYSPYEALDEFPEWRVQANLGYLEAGDAFLGISAQNPDLLAGQDPDAVKKVQKIRVEKTAPAWKHIAGFRTNWCIISGSLVGWAQKIFPVLHKRPSPTML